jgi:Ca-activated chloride channel homolog
MIEFFWPWLLLLLPLPLLVRLLPPVQAQIPQAAIRVPFLDEFGETGNIMAKQTKSWAIWLAGLAWICLILAVARPQWLGEPIELSVSGRDLMLAVDVSGSMATQDFYINKQRVDRLSAVKHIAGEFIQRRIGDRLGLILFGTQAYLHVPLTFDRKTVETLLDESFIGITDEDPKTSIGDAIGLAIKRLQDQNVDSRVLILLTDGNNTAGELQPEKAAELAAQHQLKIYTIGIGADEMLVPGFFGSQRVNPSADLDEKTLTQIAKTSGGQYFRAHNTEKIYAILDKLEPVEKDQQFFRPSSELFYWPLSIALVLSAVLAWERMR